MTREQEEAVLHITARYVAEVQAGQQPRLGDYLARYPQFADAIIDFVAYYHSVEANMPAGGDVADSLSSVARTVLEQFQAEQPTKAITTLLITANKQQLTLPQLATRLDLSVDIVSLLEQCMIDPPTIPLALCKRLARVLQLPMSVIQAYLAQIDQDATVSHSAKKRQQVAEKRTAYPQYSTQETPGVHQQSFRQVVDASVKLQTEQRKRWYSILEQEHL
jgi:hypothetical protein